MPIMTVTECRDIYGGLIDSARKRSLAGMSEIHTPVLVELIDMCHDAMRTLREQGIETYADERHHLALQYIIFHALLALEAK